MPAMAVAYLGQQILTGLLRQSESGGLLSVLRPSGSRFYQALTIGIDSHLQVRARYMAKRERKDSIQLGIL